MMAGSEKKRQLIKSFDTNSNSEEQNRLATECLLEKAECFELIQFVEIINSNRVSVWCANLCDIT